MSQRLAVVLSHPTQYYSPWFRQLAEQTDLPLRVFYLWEFGVTRQQDRQFGNTFKWDVDLLSGYEHEFVPNRSRDPGTHHFRGLDNPTLTTRLAAWQPDALLLFGYNWKSHVQAIAWARLRGIPLLFRGDSHFIGRGSPRWPKRFLLGLLYRQFRAFLAVGAANHDYFRTLGVPAQRVVFAPHAVDDSLFDPSSDEHQSAASRLRTSLRIGADQTVILFAGKFLPAKQPMELLQAFGEIGDPHATLVYVGDGPLRPELEQWAAKNPGINVRFLPFANQSEMPARYLLADLFALPSRGLYETWGLAVNEAMHMGVPALVSNRVGCQRDLVTHDQTGWVFDVEAGAGEFTATLRRAIGEVRARREFWREAARARIRGYTFPRTTDGLLAALRALSSP